MSEEKKEGISEEISKEIQGKPLLPKGLQLVYNKKTNELSLKDPQSERDVTISIVEEKEQEKEKKVLSPLTPQEFQDALQRLDNLNLTWSADRLPRIKPKTEEADAALFTEEFDAIQKEYPQMPRELSVITFHYFTGSPAPIDIVGNEEYLKEKIAIAENFFLKGEFRSEFFFKHSIKVPYFSDIDWEVNIKTFEKNVHKFTGIAYALLALTFNLPDIPKRKSEPTIITAAVDIALVDKLIATLEDVKTALESVQEITNAVHLIGSSNSDDNKTSGETDNANTDDVKQMG